MFLPVSADSWISPGLSLRCVVSTKEVQVTGLALSLPLSPSLFLILPLGFLLGLQSSSELLCLLCCHYCPPCSHPQCFLHYTLPLFFKRVLLLLGGTMDLAVTAEDWWKRIKGEGNTLLMGIIQFEWHNSSWPLGFLIEISRFSEAYPCQNVFVKQYKCNRNFYFMEFSTTSSWLSLLRDKFTVQVLESFRGLEKQMWFLADLVLVHRTFSWIVCKFSSVLLILWIPLE